MATTSPLTRPARRPASISNPASLSRPPPATSTNSTSFQGGAGRATPSPTPPTKPSGSGTTLTAKGSISRTSPAPKATPPVRRATANASVAGGSSSRPSSSLSNPRESVSRDATPSKLKVNGVGVELIDDSVQGNHEELLVRIQDLDSTVSTLATQNANLQTSLTQAETRMAELYADQNRTEEELGMRHELAEKLRSQLRDVEKEKRDLTRRYNEQTAAFEAERQSFYDNEQHLKSRIHALTQSRKEHTTPRKPRHSAVHDDTTSIVSEAEYPPSGPAGRLDGESSGPAHPGKQPRGGDATSSQDETTDDDNDPAEMTSLKLELSTLSTSHASLQSTLHLLQSQLLDLTRVNAELQEENEGWKVLVQQRTLAGTFDILTLGGANTAGDESTAGPARPNIGRSNSTDDTSSMKSTARSNALDKVSEMDEIAYELQKSGQGITDTLPPHIGRSLDSELNASTQRDSSPASRRSRRKGTITGLDSESPKGETLADLPITGPGLDLAAELGRAQNADGFIDNATGTSKTPKKVLSPEEAKAKAEMDSLKIEVKNLKDANKALSLYASKIIDRIMVTGGFEDVLAVDFQDKQASRGNSVAVAKKPRPGSLIFGMGMSDTTLGGGGGAPRPLPPKEKLTTFESIGLSNSTNSIPAYSNNNATGPPPPPKPKQPPPADDPRRSRRSMSFDWRGFSLFGGGSAEAEKNVQGGNAALLRPLQLRPGAATGGGTGIGGGGGGAVPGARKLETMEDEEDRIERERLRATMRLMGIDAMKDQNQHQYQQHAAAAAATQLRPLQTDISGHSSASGGPPSPKTAVATTSNRWSFFGGGKKNSNDAASTSSSSLAINDSYMSPPPAPTSLTTEALKQAEAESHIAALDARERVVKEEIAKGGASGFTELSGLSGDPNAPRKRIGEEWRNRRSGSGFAGSSGMGLSRSRSLRNSKEGSEAGSANTVWSAGNDDD